MSKSSKYGVNTEHFLKIQVLREKSRNTEPLTALVWWLGYGGRDWGSIAEPYSIK